MINVPARVMDALRDGRRLKEYLFYEILAQSVEKTTRGGVIETVTGDNLLIYVPGLSANYSVIVTYVKRGSPLTIRTKNVFATPGGVNIYDTDMSDGEIIRSITIHNNGAALRNTDVNLIAYGSIIRNENLVSESVKFDERMCSSDQLKFGLCEGASLEFQYFNKDSLRDKSLFTIIRVQYKKEDQSLDYYNIPMGFYTVDKCPRQSSTGIFKVTAYNKLKSKYLDADAESLAANVQDDAENGVTLATLQSLLLSDYQIQEQKGTSVRGTENPLIIDFISSSVTFKIVGSSTTYKPCMSVQLIYFDFSNPVRARLQFEAYLSKLRDVMENIKESVFFMCQNPQTFWDAYVNTYDFLESTGVQVQYLGESSIKTVYLTNSEEVTAPEHNISARDIDKLAYIYGAGTIGFMFPIEFTGFLTNGGVQIYTTDERISTDDMSVYSEPTDDINSIEIPRADLKNVTLRDLMGANYELHCQFGKLDRVTDLFSGYTLNNSRLLPADDLYPANSRYPGGWSEGGFKSQYSQLWTDSQGKLTFKYLIITYKGLDENQQAKEYTLQRTVNADGNTNYNMSNNWLFKNLVWTAQEVGAYADEMVSLMQNVSWIPFEMWAAGLPYLETGDEIEITTSEGTFTSYILQRQLNGIQNLQDTYINGTLDVF